MGTRSGDLFGEGRRIWGKQPDTSTLFRGTSNRTDQPYHFEPAISTEWRGTPSQGNRSYHRPAKSADLRGALNRTAQPYMQASMAAPGTGPVQKAGPLKYPVDMDGLEYTGEAFRVSPNFPREFRFRAELCNKTGDNRSRLLTMNSEPLDHLVIFRSNPRNGAHLIEEELSQRGFEAAKGEVITRATKKKDARTCITCLEEKPSWSDIGKTKCGHYWCGECVIARFHLATVDESSFPPKCCSKNGEMRFDRQMLKFVISLPLMIAFLKKAEEYTTPDRTYCSKLFCAKFIPPRRIRPGWDNRGVGICVECNSETCTNCKGAMHYGVCNETASKDILEALKANGWQRCSACHRIVELRTGCNHIT